MEGLWLTGMSSLRGDVTSMDRLEAPTVPVLGKRSTTRSRLWSDALIVLSDTSRRIQIHCN